MARSKPLVLGLQVIPNSSNEDGSFFTIQVARSTPANPLFFTNPALQKNLASLHLQAGHYVGYLGYSFHSTHFSKEASEWIYPFGGSGDFPSLQSIGATSGLERIALRELKKLLQRNIRLNPALYATHERAAQQHSRGIKVSPVGLHGECFDYDVSLDDLRRRINEQRRRWRIQNRLATPAARWDRMKKLGLPQQKRRLPKPK